MPAPHEIRATYDRDNIVMYQAYSPAIADAALKAQTFVPPFSMERMTWIKPSFLWLMHRSNWGSKNGQERTLAVTISRSGWEEALSKAVLTVYEPSVFKSKTDWDERFQNSEVHVQWDPERNLRGASLNWYSIQVGISRHVIREFVDDWIQKIEDFTPRVAKIHTLLRSGKADEAKRHLPVERVYTPPAAIARRLLIHS
ncbi:uncharacterized protein DUF4291 [Roseimicrobium gellanilyticum]|uniref:Uncharacterized protein DUF4291 n=1 Tax=Roseimicrobium gellanilyticum TaxID=748857 RepID=A0A366HLA9_9BACT|nr:DUF4291 domain-containing protein [Roseimicrobium gellanilyticum]RBP42543.1 uncharacterized protein DUF4291 [Roseimicrobium gellanilyticum]